MRTEVTQGEFYAVIGPQNVNGQIVTDRWPYTTEFRTPQGEVRGWRVGYLEDGAGLAKYKFYLPSV